MVLVKRGIAVVRRMNKRESGVAFTETCEVCHSIFFRAQNVQHAAANDFEGDLQRVIKRAGR